MTLESRGDHSDFHFIQMSDPQMGLYAALSRLDDAAIEEYRRNRLIVRPAPKTTGFAAETALYEKAIAGANRLDPDFVITCGDMTTDRNDPDQLAELMRITEKLDDNTPMYWVAGNHDLGFKPTAESIRVYRERFGADNYSFRHKGSSIIVFNSGVCYDPSAVPEEWERVVDFLASALEEARGSRSAHILVFTHYPLFLQHPDEDDNILVVPRERRQVLLDVLKSYGVSVVFTGHWHRNNHATYCELPIIASGAVGYPFGDDPPGFRVVKVYRDRIEHEYFGLDALPEVAELNNRPLKYHHCR